MEEIIYSQNINFTIFCYSMDFSGISKQNAHGGWNVFPKMFVGRCWYFLEKCWKTGWSEQDVRDSRTLPWMATGAVPVRIRTAVSLFIRKFTPRDATSRRDVPFAVGVRGGDDNPTLRAMHPIHKCVAKGAPHLFHWRLSSVSVGRTVYSQKQKQRLVSKLPDRCFRFEYAWLVTLKLVS